MKQVLEYNQWFGTYHIFDTNSAVTPQAGFEHVGLLTPEKMSEFEKMFHLILVFSDEPPSLERVKRAFWWFEKQ